MHLPLEKRNLLVLFSLGLATLMCSGDKFTLALILLL